MASPTESLVFGGSVYVHKYDATSHNYIAMSDSALGLALMGESTSYRLFCYNRAQEEVVTTPLDVHVKFIPQQDHYVNFYDSTGTQNYSMRFKDDAAVQAFLQAVACIKATLLCRGHGTAAHDGIRNGDGGYAVQLGDIVGMKIQAWLLDAAPSTNPIDIVASTPIMRYVDLDDLHKVKLGDASTEGLIGLSGQVVGMQKGSVRFIYLPSTGSTWILAHAELVKVKKDKRSSASPTSSTASLAATAAITASPMTLPPAVSQDDHDDEHKRDELVTRMAHLSRMGSGHALVLPSTGRRLSQSDLVHQPSQLSDKVPTPIVLTMSQPPPSHASIQSISPSTKPVRGVEETVAAPSSRAPASPPAPNARAPTSPLQIMDPTSQLRQEQESLVAEQEEIQRLRQALNAARQQQHEQLGAAPLLKTPSSNLVPTAMPPQFAPLQLPPSAVYDSYSYGGAPLAPPTSSGFLQQPSPSLPLYGVPPTSSTYTAVPFNPVAPGYAPRPALYSAPSTPSTAPPPTYVSTPNNPNAEVDTTLQRVHRTTLSMEGMLIELQRKMDRVLLSSSSGIASSYSVSPYSRRSEMSSASSSSSLLKSMERALGNLDDLQDANHRLTSQVADLKRHNAQLQDDIDRLQEDLRRHAAATTSASYAAGEVQSLQAALEHAKQRCAQMESDVQRWTTALEKERSLRMQLEGDVALASQRLASVQSQVQQDAVSAQVEEARNVAMAAQRQMQADKQANAAAASKAAAEMEALQSTHEADRAALQREMEQLRTQLSAERAAHVRDADDVKAHLDALVQERDANRAKVIAAEHAAADMEARWRREQEDAAASRLARADLFKELMNDIYFACQDAFEEEGEFTGKEVAIQIRKILKQQTVEVVAKLEK
ncbi:hypothetical protein H310_08378 [Aphanomyces invadans]|uniref:WH1 domain-containing protein n=1 Tax=Aphanomyces invadans TaxID=157072 RepID=A0A024TY22_9STRA|nr:hypothetical protein H310_08378 [Aphanomyces invadans]ETV98884.1 hypothetical protein H310_08378 [Aphanomyces invadans]|eukprot:XP_008872312.1 hypothetical protein H310_08378 [Aphanomyces invadans]